MQSFFTLMLVAMVVVTIVFLLLFGANQVNTHDKYSLQYPAAHMLKWQELSDGAIETPVIVKPKNGASSVGVMLVKTQAELQHVRDTLGEHSSLFFAQAYHPGPYEAGVFVVRPISGGKARITDIREKGHQQQSLNDWRPRTCHDSQVSCLRRHEWITPALQERFAEIMDGLPGAWYARFDVRFPSVEAFTSCDSFAILETNLLSPGNGWLHKGPFLWGKHMAYRCGLVLRHVGSDPVSFVNTTLANFVDNHKDARNLSKANAVLVKAGLRKNEGMPSVRKYFRDT